jgi:death on curing protein
MLVVLLLSGWLRSPEACLTAGSRGRTATQVLRRPGQPLLLRVTDLGLADSAVSRPQASFAGKEFYETIEAKAATLLFGVARNHPFIDGNKRVAVLAALQFLNVNGLDLNLSPPEEAYKMIAGVTAGAVTLDVLTAWISARVEPMPD